MIGKDKKDTLQRLLFWGPAIAYGDSMGALVELGVALLLGVKHPNTQPGDCIKTDIPRVDREALAKILSAGEVAETYFGYAACRICRAQLGCKDLYGHGFLWPERAEHYILEHDVWTPACSRLLERARPTS